MIVTFVSSHSKPEERSANRYSVSRLLYWLTSTSLITALPPLTKSFSDTRTSTSAPDERREKLSSRIPIAAAVTPAPIKILLFMQRNGTSRL